MPRNSWDRTTNLTEIFLCCFHALPSSSLPADRYMTSPCFHSARLVGINIQNCLARLRLSHRTAKSTLGVLEAMVGLAMARPRTSISLVSCSFLQRNRESTPILFLCSCVIHDHQPARPLLQLVAHAATQSVAMDSSTFGALPRRLEKQACTQAFSSKHRAGRSTR